MKQEFMITKKCPVCKQQKKLDDYSKNNNAEYGRYYQCKQCSVIAKRKYKESKKEGIIIAF